MVNVWIMWYEVIVQCIQCLYVLMIYDVMLWPLLTKRNRLPLLYSMFCRLIGSTMVLVKDWMRKKEGFGNVYRSLGRIPSTSQF